MMNSEGFTAISYTIDFRFVLILQMLGWK